MTGANGIRIPQTKKVGQWPTPQVSRHVKLMASYSRNLDFRQGFSLRF